MTEREIIMTVYRIEADLLNVSSRQVRRTLPDSFTSAHKAAESSTLGRWNPSSDAGSVIE